MNNEQTAACCTDLYQLPITQLLLGDSFHPGGLSLTRKLAEKTLVNRQSIVVDIAAGKGHSAQFLNRNYGATVIALDLGLINLQQLPQHKKKLQAIQANALALPLLNNSVNVVFCECALCTFDDRLAAIKEMYRVLKPGGFVAISDIFLNKKLPAHLEHNISRWLCVSNAQSMAHCQEFFGQTFNNNDAFEQLRFSDQSQPLLKTISDIEQKLKKLSYLPLVKNLSKELSNFPYQQLKEFIIDNGAGYYLLTARKPR